MGKSYCGPAFGSLGADRETPINRQNKIKNLNCCVQPLYDRARLWELLPTALVNLGPEPGATRILVQRLASALRRERARAGMHNYDLGRHMALWRAHGAEAARLRSLTTKGSGPPARKNPA
jgi:hypothetical protein